MIKTRFAPSPTGYLHVGGLRTALYAYLFAKQNKGIFALRIEDTDQKRYVEGAVENLQNTLHFFGLDWDEGPIFQSQRTELYQAHAKSLLEKGAAYRCFCSTDRLESMRQEQEKKKQAPKYDRLCLQLSKEEQKARLQKGAAHVIRQKIPQEELRFTDLIRGELQFHGKDVDDQVLIKSDGFPTYHLANVVDDHEMQISHVIRGEEWLPSTPKHLWLYQAFEWTPPQFAHLPLLLNPDRSKLSKRQGDVTAEDYIKKGYLKEAVLNFIAFLGWNPGTEEELFSLPELIERFSLDRVQKAGAVFNGEKLDWLNGLYIRKLSPQELTQRIFPWLQETDWFKKTEFSSANKVSPPEKLVKRVMSVQTRMKTLADSAPMLKPLLLSELDYDRSLFSNEKMKVDRTMAIMALEQSIPILENLEESVKNWTEENIKASMLTVIEKLGVKNGQVLWPLRVALTNETFSPGSFELIALLGKQESLKRLRKALEALRQ